MRSYIRQLALHKVEVKVCGEAGERRRRVTNYIEVREAKGTLENVVGLPRWSAGVSNMRRAYATEAPVVNVEKVLAGTSNGEE